MTTTAPAVIAERRADGSIALTPNVTSSIAGPIVLDPAVVDAVVALALGGDEALERVLRVLPNIDAGNDVRRWPEDEADLHRNGDWLSFTERNQAVHDYRRGKVASAILAELAKGA